MCTYRNGFSMFVKRFFLNPTFEIIKRLFKEEKVK